MSAISKHWVTASSVVTSAICSSAMRSCCPAKASASSHADSTPSPSRSSTRNQYWTALGAPGSSAQKTNQAKSLNVIRAVAPPPPSSSPPPPPPPPPLPGSAVRGRRWGRRGEGGAGGVGGALPWRGRGGSEPKRRARVGGAKAAAE